MEADIRKIGNSKGIIIPRILIDKYDLKKVRFEETKDGILLVSIDQKSHFAKKMEELRKKKDEWSSQMRVDANDPEIIAHYKSEAKEMGDVDTMPIE